MAHRPKAGPPTPQPLRIDWLLEDHGWASFRLRCGAAEITIGSFGHCTDPLPDLLRAAATLIAGGSYAEAVFDGEPPLWGLALEPVARSPARAPVLRLDLMAGGERMPFSALVKTWPRTLLTGHVTAEEFGRAMVRAADALLGSCGESGYAERWTSFTSDEPFPHRALAALRTALAAVK